MTEGNWSYVTLAGASAFRLADEAAERKRGAPVQPQGVEAIHNLFRHRCCGYQIPPKAEDVVRGLKKGTWSDREHRAMEHMRTYGFPTGRIDLLEPEEPGLWPMEPVQIGQRVVFREATASILYGKLAGRGTDPPVRDPFDIAVAGEKAPSALDAAVRTAGSERMNAVLQVWQEKESEFSTWSLVDLQDVKPLWSDFREDPGYHGRRTLEEAMRRVGFQIEYRRMHRGGIP